MKILIEDEFVPVGQTSGAVLASGDSVGATRECRPTTSVLRTESSTTKFVYISLIVLTILCSGYTAFRGVDFGQHSDEGNFIETVVTSFKTKTLCPADGTTTGRFLIP